MSKGIVEAKLEDCGYGLFVTEGDIVLEPRSGSYYEVVAVGGNIVTSRPGCPNFVTAQLMPTEAVDDEHIANVNVEVLS